LSESSQGNAVSISAWWLALLVAFLAIEIAFLAGAYTSGEAGLERIFSVFTGLILITFGIILYAGRLIFYD